MQRVTGLKMSEMLRAIGEELVCEFKLFPAYLRAAFREQMVALILLFVVATVAVAIVTVGQF